MGTQRKLRLDQYEPGHCHQRQSTRFYGLEVRK